MMKRTLKVAVPLTAMGLAGGYYHNELKAMAATVVDPQQIAQLFNSGSLGGHLMPYQPPTPYQGLYANNGFFNESMSPQTKWNHNWDNREPEHLVDQEKYETASEEERRAMLDKARPSATRHIFLVRHGQYNLDSEENELTELGRQQAAALGKRLSMVNLKFNRCVISTMTRASETAALMLGNMDGNIPTHHDPMIEEGAPYPPEPKVSHWRPRMKINSIGAPLRYISFKEFFIDGSRIEAAYRKYIHRASPKQKEDSYEILVCHGNVIRYFVCRALQFPPEGWLRLATGHTGVTWLMIRPNGMVSLRSFGDVGHLPAEKISFG